MNRLHVGHFPFMQDNFTDNITFIEQGQLVGSFFLFSVVSSHDGDRKMPISNTGEPAITRSRRCGGDFSSNTNTLK